MSTREDLIAARALIANLPADAAVDVLDAMIAATNPVFDYRRVLPMADALDAELPPLRKGASVRAYIEFCEAPTSARGDILALFDRAISTESGAS